MNDEVWQLARSVTWATTPDDVAAAQARLWRAVAPDMELYHLLLWKAGLEKTDYLRWERSRQQAMRRAMQWAG